MTFISSQRVHFVTFLCSHLIKKLLLQNVFVFLSNRKICQKRIKNDIHFVTKCSFCHFFVSSSNQKLLLHKVLVFSSIRKRIKNDIRFVTFWSNHRSKKLLLQKVCLILSNRKMYQKRIKHDLYFVTKCSFRHFFV